MPELEPAPSVKVGDVVRFYFVHQRHARMEQRRATVVAVAAEDPVHQIPKGTFVDLDVDFTAEDLAAGVAKVQTHCRRGTTGDIQSGEWMPLPTS